MQKKLIALAIAGLTSTAAFAQTNVTIYGVMDASIDLIDEGDGPGTTGRNETQINSNSSRLGMKGTEDLGNGLKANFQIETSIGADGTATAMNSRNTYVGLSGNFGEVRVGRHDTPYKMSTRRLDPFADHLADNRNLMGLGNAGFDIRTPDSVTYLSPDMNGFAFAGAYATTGEGANAVSGTEKDSIVSLSGSYTAGVWYTTVAYQKNKLGTGTAFFPLTPGDSESAVKFGVGYTTGALQLGFVFEDVSSDAAVAGAEVDHRAWTLGGSYTAGNGVFKAAYTVLDDVNDVSDTGAKQWALGYEHIMSKRTKLYAEYVRLDNDSLAGFMLNGAGTTAVSSFTAGALDSNASALSAGIRHAF